MRVDVSTNEQVEVIDVTEEITSALTLDNETGLCGIFVPHTTAGIIVNEYEPRLVSDLETLLDQLVPRTNDYRHDDIDDNADAHLRAMLLGESVFLPINDGELRLGTWQSIMFVECDGPRSRHLLVTEVTN